MWRVTIVSGSRFSYCEVPDYARIRRSSLLSKFILKKVVARITSSYRDQFRLICLVLATTSDIHPR